MFLATDRFRVWTQFGQNQICSLRFLVISQWLSKHLHLAKAMTSLWHQSICNVVISSMKESFHDLEYWINIINICWEQLLTWETHLFTLSVICIDSSHQMLERGYSLNPILMPQFYVMTLWKWKQNLQTKNSNAKIITLLPWVNLSQNHVCILRPIIKI